VTGGRRVRSKKNPRAPFTAARTRHFVVRAYLLLPLEVYGKKSLSIRTTTTTERTMFRTSTTSSILVHGG
jgi:hypothetical protein